MLYVQKWSSPKAASAKYLFPHRSTKRSSLYHLQVQEFYVTIDSARCLTTPERSLPVTVEIALKDAKSILTPQHHGFLAARPYPFTHALSGYIGCGFGQTTCGLYCYAQFLPNWSLSGFTAAWGQAVQVKTNAAQLLDKELRTM